MSTLSILIRHSGGKLLIIFVKNTVHRASIPQNRFSVIFVHRLRNKIKEEEKTRTRTPPVRPPQRINPFRFLPEAQMFQMNRGRSSGSPHVRQSSHPYDSDFWIDGHFPRLTAAGTAPGLKRVSHRIPYYGRPALLRSGHLHSTKGKGKPFLQTIKRSRPFPVRFFAHFIHK